MNRDVWDGRWLKLRGRVKMAAAKVLRSEALSAEGNADVIAGSLQESYGTAKKTAAREVARGIDAVADVAKKTVKALEK